MHQEDELQVLLDRLEAWRKRKDEVMNRVYSKELPVEEVPEDLHDYSDEFLPIEIMDDVDHSGVDEWVRCLKYVLEQEYEEY